MEYRGNSEKRKYSGFSRALLVATLIVTGCSLGQSIEPTLTPIVVPPTAVVVATAEVPTIEPTGPTEVVKATPSYAPATPTPIPPTISPVPTVALTGKVCATCESLRVRQTPGTAGKIITQLPSGTAVTLIGRTADSTWFQVITPDGKTGWGWAAFITTTDDVNKLSVTTLNTANEPTSSPAPTQLSAPTTGNVVTGVTSTSRQIFLNGQAKGNLATVFTRIGDSLTASPAFLNPLAGAHDLSTYSAFDIDLGYFSGPNARGANPFVAASLAERNNWTTRDVLDPANVPGDICQSGETTVSCEYRLVKPSVSLILIGTNDSARDISPTEFQHNLQTIVQTSIDMGVIPVLSTLPPKHLNDFFNNRVDEYNGIIVGVARANDIPLWNLWLALQPLPNNGIHPDGVHLNSPPDGKNANFDATHLDYGFPMRNLTALFVLDTLRRQVLYGGNAGGQAGGIKPAVLPSLPAAQACSGAPLPRLVVGGKGKVTPGLPNKLRAGPHKNDTVIGNMPPGATFTVIGGPLCGDGFRWWQVTYNGLNAWTADGVGSENWLLPAS